MSIIPRHLSLSFSLIFTPLTHIEVTRAVVHHARAVATPARELPDVNTAIAVDELATAVHAVVMPVTVVYLALTCHHHLLTTDGVVAMA